MYSGCPLRQCGHCLWTEVDGEIPNFNRLIQLLKCVVRWDVCQLNFGTYPWDSRGHSALAKAGPGQWPQLHLGSTFSLSAGSDIAPGPAMQAPFIPGHAAASAAVWRRVCVHTGHKERNKCEWEGESPKDWDRCAIQSSEGTLCSLNYLWCFRLGMLCLGAIQLLALLSTKTQKQKLQSGGRKGL